MKMSKLEKKFVNSQRHAERMMRVVNPLIARIDLQTVTDVLEIGCGAGALAAHLSQRHGMHVTGTDVDPDQIEAAKEFNSEGEHLRFFEADAASLPFGDSEFDMVLSVNVLHHMADWQQALGNVNRVLRSGGHYVFVDFAYPRFVKKTLGPIVKQYGIYTLSDVVGVLEGKGMRIVHRGKSRDFVVTLHHLIFRKD